MLMKFGSWRIQNFLFCNRLSKKRNHIIFPYHSIFNSKKCTFHYSLWSATGSYHRKVLPQHGVNMGALLSVESGEQSRSRWARQLVVLILSISNYVAGHAVPHWQFVWNNKNKNKVVRNTIFCCGILFLLWNGIHFISYAMLRIFSKICINSKVIIFVCYRIYLI